MHYDAVVVGAGHNGLTAAAYLARAGRRVLVLERLRHVGGLALSAPVFPGVAARLSRYSYLVSLLPARLARDLGLRLSLRSRRFSAYTPLGDAGLLIDDADPERTARSFAAIGSPDLPAWRRFHEMCAAMAEAVFPTMLEPLPDRADLRDRVAGVDPHTLAPRAWRDLVERPIAETVDEWFGSDLVRGTVLTDALIGTFAPEAMGPCFLYHIAGGEWRVPVGGMGAVSAALAEAARTAGATIATGREVRSIDPGGRVVYGDGEEVTAGHVLAAVPPQVLARLLGEPVPPPPEGSQLKVNMVLRRLPRLRDGSVAPEEAFSGTFHINESGAQLARAYEEAASGRIPALPPCEVYCHTLTDPSILSPELRGSGAHTMTLFGLHMPARLFRDDPARSRKAALEATLRSVDSVLAEPLADVLLADANGEPCLEVKTPVDLETEAGLPGGHIFHGDLTWPWRADGDEDDPWGVRTAYDRVLLCGAGARRGGGVSGIAGHNAAAHVLTGSNRGGARPWRARR